MSDNDIIEILTGGSYRVNKVQPIELNKGQRIYPNPKNIKPVEDTEFKKEIDSRMLTIVDAGKDENDCFYLRIFIPKNDSNPLPNIEVMLKYELRDVSETPNKTRNKISHILSGITGGEAAVIRNAKNHNSTRIMYLCQSEKVIKKLETKIDDIYRIGQTESKMSKVVL